ncbi:MAG: ATP-grasp domain-containing protein [candidate division KSB1 bacterium]|nr:ATP-grasp domain-containing protein [candidate division KSB1 bacterium]
MPDSEIHAGIAYNVHESRISGSDESLSESSVVQAAHDVSGALRNAGYNPTLVPLRKSLPGFMDRLKSHGFDIIINLCEGFRGKPQWEFTIAGLFEMEGIPFTGNKADSLLLCQDKFKTKAILSASGLSTPPYILMSNPDQSIELAFPLIVKPNNEDASLGIYSDSVVWNKDALRRQAGKIIRKYNQPALVESFVKGREFNVAVRDLGTPHTLPISEIDFSDMPGDVPHICGYEAKWFENHILYNASKPVCPARVPASLRKTLQKAAIDAFRAVGCRDYARVDFRVDDAGEAYILEVNPNPDISLNAGYARALAAASIRYEIFWHELIQHALQRKLDL